MATSSDFWSSGGIRLNLSAGIETGCGASAADLDARHEADSLLPIMNSPEGPRELHADRVGDLLGRGGGLYGGCDGKTADYYHDDRRALSKHEPNLPSQGRQIAAFRPLPFLVTWN